VATSTFFNIHGDDAYPSFASIILAKQRRNIGDHIVVIIKYARCAIASLLVFRIKA